MYDSPKQSPITFYQSNCKTFQPPLNCLAPVNFTFPSANEQRIVLVTSTFDDSIFMLSFHIIMLIFNIFIFVKENSRENLTWITSHRALFI